MRKKIKIKWESGYIVRGDWGRYLVTFERLKNTYCGNPRYKMKITALDHNDIEYKSVASIIWYGHYKNDFQECEMAVNEYEKEIAISKC